MKEIKNLIANSKIDKAFDRLLKSKLSNNDLILLRSRWSTVHKDVDKGIVSYEQTNLERNKIISSLLNVIGEIEREQQTLLTATNRETGSRIRKKEVIKEYISLDRIVSGEKLTGLISYCDSLHIDNDGCTNIETIKTISSFVSLSNDFRFEIQIALDEINKLTTQKGKDAKAKDYESAIFTKYSTSFQLLIDTLYKDEFYVFAKLHKVDTEGTRYHMRKMLEAIKYGKGFSVSNDPVALNYFLIEEEMLIIKLSDITNPKIDSSREQFVGFEIEIDKIEV